MKSNLDKNKKQIKFQQRYFSKEVDNIQKYQLDPWQKTYIRRIKEDLLNKNFKGKNLIDIGSGSGYVSIEMSKMGLKVTACDITEKYLKHIRKYKNKFSLNNLDLINCSADSIPLKNNSFDYVVANAILEHLFFEKKAIREWKRILKPTGKIFIAVPIKFRYLWPFFIPLNYIYDKRIGHLRRYDLKTIKQKFRMKVDRVYYLGHLIKMMISLISLVYKNKNLNNFAEIMDSKFSGLPWGSSNIIVILSRG